MEIEYKGHKIIFREHDESWFHELIGDKKTLAAAKSALDNLSRKDRQIGVKALRLEGASYRSIRKVQEVTVTTLCEARPRSRFGNEPPQITECWITYGKKDREKVSISNLYPLESRSDLEACVKLQAAALKASEDADAALRAIESYDADILALAAKEKAGAA